jgi:hypothetical protein
MTDLLQDFREAFFAAIADMARFIRKHIIDPIIRWLRSPQVQAVVKAIARISGIKSMPVRRKAVSTKRARIYQRKMREITEKA